MTAAIETTSIEFQLRALVRLQYFDSRVDQLTKLQGDLPDEIRDLEDEKEGLETRIENVGREASEGELTRMRARLVRKDTLSEVARQLGIGDHLVLGGGESRSGGHQRGSILADALEADAEARRFVERSLA